VPGLLSRILTPWICFPRHNCHLSNPRTEPWRQYIPPTSPVVIACFATFAVVACIFIYIETHAKQPLMPLPLLTKAPIANMVFANLLGGIASNTVWFHVPLFFRAVLLTSASSSGFRLAVPSLVGSAAGISTDMSSLARDD
jgi:hypothetical protein